MTWKQNLYMFSTDTTIVVQTTQYIVHISNTVTFFQIYIFLILTWGCVYWFERQRGRGREKHGLVASHMHLDWGSNPQPLYLPWLGNESATFWYTRHHFTQLSHSQGFPNIFNPWSVKLADLTNLGTQKYGESTLLFIPL